VQLEQDLALLTVNRSRQDPETRVLLDARARAAAEREAEARLAMLQARAQVDPDAHAMEGLYLDEIRQLERKLVNAKAEIEQWVDEADALRREQERLQRKVAYFEGRFGSADAAEGRAGVLRAASNIEELVRLASEHFTQTLHFLPHALESAAGCEFEDIEAVRRAFEAMDEAAKLQARAGSLGQSLYEFFSERSLEYCSHIAVTTPARLRRQYDIPDAQGNTHVCHAHFKFGRSYDPRECLRIYLNADMSENRFVIGWITQHAETIKTN